MQIGIDSFAAAISDPATGLTLTPVERMQHLLEEIELADKVGLDLFGIGEHHRPEFLDSAPVVILSAAASRTKSIRLTSAVTVLSAADPVRRTAWAATITRESSLSSRESGLSRGGKLAAATADWISFTSLTRILSPLRNAPPRCFAVKHSCETGSKTVPQSSSSPRASAIDTQ